MSVFPAGLCTGMVHGRFIVAVIDGPDDDRDPDVVPARGRIVFRASVEYVTIRVGGEPVTVTLAPIAGVLDDEGYLCTPHPETGEPMYRGVTLTSSDGPGMSVTGWTWSADYRLDPVGTAVVKVPAHSFVLPCGGSVDLGDLVKVPSSPGIGIPQMEAVVLRAEAAATESGESAAQAALIAQSVRDDADAGLFKGDPGKDGAPGNATLRVDNTAGKRVFISDGTTEHMISADTGWRGVVLPEGDVVASGVVRWRRVNERVYLRLENVILKPGSGYSVLMGTVPGGFGQVIGDRTMQFVGLANNALVQQTITAFPNTVAWIYQIASGAVNTTRPTGGAGLQGTISWQTDNPWPTTLPGTPA